MADQQIGGMTCAEADELAPAFVLGALAEPEMAAVRRHLAECASAHPEFAQIGSVAATLFEAVPIVEPPAGLGQRIMAAARAEQAEHKPAAAQEASAAVEPAPPLANVVRLRPRQPESRPSPWRNRLAWVALASAAAIVIAALGAWNLQLRSQVDELTAYRTAVLAVLDRASGPSGQLAILAAPDASGNAAGIAGIGADGTVAIAMRNLAPTAGTEVYEVWVIGGDGKAVPVGDFTVGASGAGGTVTVSGSTETGVTVALTHEPRPGMTAPTPPIVALGKSRPQTGG